MVCLCQRNFCGCHSRPRPRLGNWSQIVWQRFGTTTNEFARRIRTASNHCSLLHAIGQMHSKTLQTRRDRPVRCRHRETLRKRRVFCTRQHCTKRFACFPNTIRTYRLRWWGYYARFLYRTRHHPIYSLLQTGVQLDDFV